MSDNQRHPQASRATQPWRRVSPSRSQLADRLREQQRQLEPYPKTLRDHRGPIEADPEAQQGDAVQQQEAEAERLPHEEEDRRALAAKGQHVHEEILQTKMGDQNVFITSQQNIIAAKTLFDSVEPMMAEDHAATPVVTRIKAMVTAAAIQHYEEGNRAPSASRPASSRQPSSRERVQGSQRNVADARSSISNNHDARNIIDGHRHEREEDENHRCDDE